VFEKKESAQVWRNESGPLIRLQPGDSDDRSELERADSALLDQIDHPEIARWIQFPIAVLLFLVIPGDLDGGALTYLTAPKITVPSQMEIREPEAIETRGSGTRKLAAATSSLNPVKHV
jgi:hypothetical protein